MKYILRRNNDNKEYILGCVTAPVITKNTSKSFLINALRMLFVFPVLFISKYKSPLLMPKFFSSQNYFVRYREDHSGSYIELMRKKSGNEDISFLSNDSKKIFDV